MSTHIVIVGAGIVGSVLALRLSKLPGIKIKILTDKELVIKKTSEDLRLSAISPASWDLLVATGANIQQEKICPFTSMLVWDAVTQAEIRFTSKELGRPNLGYMIHNTTMLQALWQCVLQDPNIEVIVGTGINLAPRVLKFNTNNVQQTLAFDLLIGADGINSWVRQEMQVSCINKPYQQKAIVAEIATKFPHRNCARQCFATNPIAMLPLMSERRCSLVWSADDMQVARLLALTKAEFSAELTKYFAKELGQLELVGGRQSFNLTLLHAKNYIAERIALVGDSAHVVHPLAGFGLNLGLHDVAQFHSVLTQAIKAGRDICSHRVLRQYERRARSYNTNIIYGIDALWHCFRWQQPCWRQMRNFGLHMLNNTRYFKNKIAHFVLGNIQSCATL